MEKRGLVVSWFFPPATSAEGLVTFKLLRASAFSYDVLSAESEKWSYGAKSLLTSPNIALHPLQAPSFPVWERACADEAERLMAQNRYDFLMTRAMPPESHTAGLRIKRRHPELFWIASMGDPIGHNPYDRDRYFRRGTGALLKNPLRTAARAALYLYKEWFDRRITRKADLLLYPSLEQCRFTLGRRYEKYRDKVLILPHSFDTNILEAAGAPSPCADGRIELSYLGYLSGQRTAEGLIRGAAKLLECDPEAGKRLVIRIVGRLPEEQASLIRTLHAESLFRVEPPVDYMQSLRVMKGSDWLLFIDADFPFMPHNIFLVSKLADYMGACRPILGLTTPEGPSGALLRQAGCPVVQPGDAQGIAEILGRIAHGTWPAPDFSVYEQLDSKRVAAVFDRRLGELNS